MNITLNWKDAVRKLIGGKTKERSQLCLIGTEDGRLISIELDVLRACAVDERRESAYLLDASNQAKSRKDGKWYQLLGERSTLPIGLFHETSTKDLKSLVRDIYREAKEATKDKKYREAKENKLWVRFTWLVSMIVVAAIVLVFLRGW